MNPDPSHAHTPLFPSFVPSRSGVPHPDVIDSYKALHAARDAYDTPWVQRIGQQVVHSDAIRKSQDAKAKKLKDALVSYDKLYAFLMAEGMLASPHYETYTKLLHQVKQLELASGWSVTRLYVEWVIDCDNKFKDPRSMQERVGPTPADGNFFKTLDQAGLLQCHLSSFAKMESKLSGRSRDTKDSPRKSAGSPTKDDKHKYFCKHHGMYYTNPDHTTSTCRKGNSSLNGTPASQNGGAGSD